MKTTESTTTGLSGMTEVLRLGPRVMEFRSTGYSTRAGLQRALRRADELLREHPSVNAVLWDTLGLVGHDPGNPAHAIQWLRAHGDRIQTVVLVTRTQGLRGVGNAARIMMPHAAVHTVSRREDGLAIVESSAPRAARSSAA